MVLFTADDGMHGADLWGSDGTETGTRLLKDINAAGDSWAGGFTYINIAPDDITIAYGWVPENSAAGTFAGNLRAVDFDLTDFDLTETHTYTLLDDAGGRFILEDNVVKTASSTAFDFEGVNSYTITVRATDQGGKSVEKQLVIAVADVNEAPTNIALSKSNIAEHAGSGTTVGILTAADFDLTDTHTFTLMTNAGGRFELHDDKLVVANGALLDYEQKASHTVTVRANDGRGGFIEKTFTISLDDVAAESFTGDPFANVFSGGAGNDSIAGGAGDDKIAGFGGADHLFGGDGADTLLGGEGDDRLDGGPGIDSLVGGNGSDYYRITSGDVIVESAGSGTKDRVHGLNMSFDLGTFAGGFIEQAVVDGLLNVKLTGNAAANALWGNHGANTLNGKLGLDYLVGGIGNDKFVFDTKLSTQNVDRIVDFQKGDRICLDNAIFSKLGAPGALNADFFRPHRADDRNDFIHYDKATGALFYDADGNGRGPGIKFAVVETKLALTDADFLVI
jgi:ELWxxDGT repeat protein